MGMKKKIGLNCRNLKMEPELCFESRNNSCIKTDYPMAMRVSLHIIFGVVVILTVCGNLLVILSISYFKQLHSPTNYLILSLAMSDLLVGIIVMLPHAVQIAESCWYFGEMICNVSKSLSVSLVTASIINLSFISVDRYCAVCRPLLYRTKMSTNVVLIMILICWTVSPIVGFGMFFMKLSFIESDDMSDNNLSCDGECSRIRGEPSASIVSILSFFMPGIILLGVNLEILYVAKRQFSRIQNNNGVKAVNSSNKRIQAKATKTLAIVMGVFFFSWTPFFLCALFNPYSSNLVPQIVLESLLWMGFLNSAVNPLIYAFFYSWFRKAFYLLISGKMFQSDVSETKLLSE